MSSLIHHAGCSYQVQVKPGFPLIELALNGSAQPEVILEAYSNIVELTRETGIRAILIDSTNLRVNIDAMEIYDLVEQVATMLNGLVVARVIDPSQFSFYLVEQQLQSRAVMVKNFECYELALDWALTHSEVQQRRSEN